MRKFGPGAEQDFIVALRSNSNYLHAPNGDFVRLVSPLSDPGETVQLQTFEEGDDSPRTPRPQITRSVSDPAVRTSGGLQSPRSHRPRRNSTLTSNVSDFFLTMNGSHPNPEEEEQSEEQEQMRHAMSDQPAGRLELFVRSSSGVIRQMVEEEQKRWHETQEQWLLAAKAARDEDHEAGKRWAFQGPIMGSNEQLYLDGSRSVCMTKARIQVSRVLQSQFFELALGLVIVANALVIGLEQSFRADGHETFVFDILEYVFLGIYTVEMCLRFFVSGWRCLKDDWVKFDFVLLLSGLAGSIFITPYFGFDQITPLLVLRTFRLLRLARTVKLLMKCRNLWMLVRGLMSSVGTMMPILLLLVIILYVFSALGFEMLKYHEYANGDNADEEFRNIVETHFSSLTLTMMTLVQFISMDSVAAIYRPLVMKDWTLAIYFHILILLVFVVLMNLVTAVIVNSAFEQASQDREAQQVYEQRRKEKLVGDLVRTFQKLDANGDGMICQDELMGASGDDLKSLYQNLKLDNPEEIFLNLDVDGTGEIDITEFCEGVLQAATSQGSIELKRMDKQMKSMKKQLNEMERAQAGFGDLLAQALQENHFLVQAAYTKRQESVNNVEEQEGPPPWAKAMMLEMRNLSNERRASPARAAWRTCEQCFRCEQCCRCRWGPDGRPRRGLGIRDRLNHGSPNDAFREKSSNSIASSPGFPMMTAHSTSEGGALSGGSASRRPSGRLNGSGPSGSPATTVAEGSSNLGSWSCSQELRPRCVVSQPVVTGPVPVREETETSDASGSTAGRRQAAARRLRGILVGGYSSAAATPQDQRTGSKGSSAKGTASLIENKAVGFSGHGGRSPSVATTLSMQRVDSCDTGLARAVRHGPPAANQPRAAPAGPSVPSRFLERKELSI